MGVSTKPGSAIGEDGHSTISGCWIKDAGLVDTSNGEHGIELCGVKHMTVTGNTVQGSHVGSMFMQSNGGATMWYEGGLYRSYNVISGNTFDGVNSPYSFVYLCGGSNWTFTNNTVTTRAFPTIVQNSTDSLLTGNTVSIVYAEGSLQTSQPALRARGTDGLTLGDNTFRSKVNGTIWFSSYNDTPSTNNTVDGNTFVKDAADSAVSVDDGCDCTETNSTYLTDYLE
jgi:hypothetical protein